MKQIIRFWNNVQRTDDHWLWTGRRMGPLRAPYVRVGRTHISARRIAWTLAPGRRPSMRGKYLHAACGESQCVRPDHMERRAHSGGTKRDVCRRGHPFAPENVYTTSQGKRACRQCMTTKIRERRDRYLKEGRGWGRSYTPLSPIGDTDAVTVPSDNQ